MSKQKLQLKKLFLKNGYNFTNTKINGYYKAFKSCVEVGQFLTLADAKEFLNADLEYNI